MNKFFLFILLAFSLASCQNINEEVTIHEDGSGEFSIYSDMTASVKQTAAMMHGLSKSDESIEEFEQHMMEKFWNDMGGETMDSILDYSTMVEDSVLNDPKLAYFFENTEMFMFGSKELGYLNTGIRGTFDEVKQFSDNLNLYEEHQRSNNGGMNSAMGVKQGKSEGNLSFDGQTYKRVYRFTEKPQYPEHYFLMAGGFDGFYTSTISFSKKIKNIKGNYLKSQTDSSATFAYPMDKYMNGEIEIELEIQLEN